MYTLCNTIELIARERTRNGSRPKTHSVILFPGALQYFSKSRARSRTLIMCGWWATTGVTETETKTTDRGGAYERSDDTDRTGGGNGGISWPGLLAAARRSLPKDAKSRNVYTCACAATTITVRRCSLRTRPTEPDRGGGRAMERTLLHTSIVRSRVIPRPRPFGSDPGAFRTLTPNRYSITFSGVFGRGGSRVLILQPPPGPKK